MLARLSHHGSAEKGGLTVLPRFAYGAPVRVVRDLRNDGTFAGVDTGAVLVRSGSVGYVRESGPTCRTRSSTRWSSPTPTGWWGVTRRS